MIRDFVEFAGVTRGKAARRARRPVKNHHLAEPGVTFVQYGRALRSQNHAQTKGDDQSWSDARARVIRLGVVPPARRIHERRDFTVHPEGWSAWRNRQRPLSGRGHRRAMKFHMTHPAFDLPSVTGIAFASVRKDRRPKPSC